jgi:hypothetical protein
MKKTEKSDKPKAEKSKTEKKPTKKAKRTIKTGVKAGTVGVVPVVGERT